MTSFAVILLYVEASDSRRTVRLWDCSARHSGRVDMHRYSWDGTKDAPETFAYATIPEAFREARERATEGYRQMIDSWLP